MAIEVEKRGWLRILKLQFIFWSTKWRVKSSSAGRSRQNASAEVATEIAGGAMARR
jgi:hypothetical protein